MNAYDENYEIIINGDDDIDYEDCFDVGSSKEKEEDEDEDDDEDDSKEDEVI
jgi:hypothetical protein